MSRPSQQQQAFQPGARRCLSAYAQLMAHVVRGDRLMAFVRNKEAYRNLKIGNDFSYRYA
jgi:hypothetical protein